MPAQKVLIIDDDADMRRLLALWMTKQDYQTVFAADVIQAIALARQHRPDLIVLDPRMPEAQPGYHPWQAPMHALLCAPNFPSPEWAHT